MAEVFFTHRIGSRQIDIDAVMERDEVLRLLREDVGAIFQLASVSWDDTGKASIRLIPSHGCAELTTAERGV